MTTSNNPNAPDTSYLAGRLPPTPRNSVQALPPVYRSLLQSRATVLLPTQPQVPGLHTSPPGHFDMSFPGQPTTNTLSHPTPPSSNSKRPADYDERTQPAPKRVHLIVNEGAQNIPPIAGSGPFTPGAVRPSPPQHPAFSKFGSRRSKTNSGSSNVASDVWWFMYPVPSKERPAENARAPPDFQPLKARPRNTPIMACRLCTGDEWRVWKCDDGRTSRVREHLEKDHWAIYYEQVMQHKLKGWETLPERAREANRPVISSNTREPFTLEGFYQRLVKWMAASDQSFNVLDCPELRELLLYLGGDLLQDGDLPHRSKIGSLIVDQFRQEYEKMIAEIQKSEGRVSFTADVWSRQTLQPYMAVTAHYMVIAKDEKDDKNRLVMRSRLVAFRHVPGSHTGEYLAQVFFSVLRELNILDRIGMITLDNASNNGTMMESLARMLNFNFRRVGLHFNHKENRIRCFPHVVNISVKTGLKYLTKAMVGEDDADFVSPEDVQEDDEQVPHDDADIDYLEVLEDDIIAMIRKLVNSIRASDQRREALAEAIRSGNEANEYDPPIREVSLLRDVDTRWSSIYLMIDRFLELYPAIRHMITTNNKYYRELGDLLFTDLQLRVVYDIREYLFLFHNVQQTVSADKTPTLSVVLPVYEDLLTLLEKTQPLLRNLSHAFEASIRKLKEYLGYARETKAYLLAMFVNPKLKLTRFERIWSSSDELEHVIKSIKELMLIHQRDISASSPPPILPTPGRRSVSVASPSARSVNTGMAQIQLLLETVSSGRLPGEANTPSSSQTQSNSEDLLVNSLNSGVDDDDQVESEFTAWVSAGVITDKRECEEFDIVQYWQFQKFRYPILYRVAMDVLPVQASAVPCERAFSSSKETDTLRRSRLGPVLMEVLQILKHLYRADRLDFSTGRLSTTDADGAELSERTMLDVDVGLVDGLLKLGEVELVEDIIRASYSSTE